MQLMATRFISNAMGPVQITECFGLEGTFQGHLVQPSCDEHGHHSMNFIFYSVYSCH